MRCVTGAILLAAAEQAFAHAWLIPFPHREAAVLVLYPGSLVLLGLGLTFLIWGVLSEPRQSRAEPKIAPGSTRS